MLLTKTGDVWAFYKINPTSIGIGNTKKVVQFKKGWEKFYEEIAPYEDFQMFMFPKDYQLESRFEALSDDFDPQMFDVAQYYAEETCSILEHRLGEITEYEFILGVKLKDSLLQLSEGVKENVENVLSVLTDNIINVLGFEQTVSEKTFDRYKGLQEELENIVLSVDGNALEEEELVYLSRFQFIRGISHSVEEESFNTKVSAINNTLLDPTSPSVLKLSSDIGESYASFVVIDEFLEDMSETDVFYSCQMLPFPVEVNVKAKVEKKSHTKSILSLKKQGVKDSANEQARAGEAIETSTETSYGMIHHLQEQLKSEENRIYNWLATVVVTGESKKECLEKAAVVKRHFKGQDIKTRLPVADQLQLFYKFLVGESLSTTDVNWIQKTLQDGLAELGLGLSAELGFNVGWHIGFIDRYEEHLDRESALASSRDNVLYHPLLSNQQIKGSKTRSPHELITGDTGGGKSYLAKMIFIYTTMLDIKTLYIDPKQEMRKWFKLVLKDVKIRRDFPDFIKLVESYKFITLDASNCDNWGAIDPIVLLSAMEAKEMHQVAIGQFYSFKGKEKVETIYLQTLSEVISRRAQGEQVGSMTVIEQMRVHADKDVREVGNLLYEKIEGSILKLMFHDGSNPALNVTEKTTILEIEDFDLPDADMDAMTYTESQLKSNSIMLAIGKFCELFGKNKDEKTKVFIDEAWIFMISASGKRTKKQMLRVGRSCQNSMALISQGVRDGIEEKESGNFGMYFAFDEPNNRKGILEVMGMEVSESNIDLFDNFFQGQCLYKDFYGNVGKMTVDCLFEEWQSAFKTVEKSSVAIAEEKFA